MAANLLQYGDYNVIVTHWGNGANVGYVQAVANTRLVGLEIALLVNTMVVGHNLNTTLSILKNSPFVFIFSG